MEEITHSILYAYQYYVLMIDREYSILIKRYLNCSDYLQI